MDQTQLINELTRGMELARQLKSQMGHQFSPQNKQIILQQIVSSYDKALSILGCGSNVEHPHQLISCSPASSNGQQDFKECSLKRKLPSIWTNQVKGHDGPPYDGYSWRKYGQKDILGAKFPRSYYRCTYRNVQDCWATKQVQRSDDDPSVFEITYKGTHTCNMGCRSKSAPTTPGKLELKQELSPQNHDMRFVGTTPFEMADMENLASFPSTELDGYAMLSLLEVETLPNEAQNRERYLDGGIGDVVFGAASSTTNSTIIQPNFTLDSSSF